MMVWCSGFHNLYAKILSGMNINQYRTISEFNIEKHLRQLALFSPSRVQILLEPVGLLTLQNIVMKRVSMLPERREAMKSNIS